MKNKINLIALLAISAGLYACGSGSGTSSTTQTTGFQGGEYGPIPVNMYDNLLARKLKPSSLNEKSLQGAGVSADTAAATGVMAAVFPPAAVVLGPISAISGLVAADQVAAQINQINNELNYQESQIQQIYMILNDSYNYFVTQSKVANVNVFSANYKSWYNNLVGPSLFYGYGETKRQVSPIDNSNMTAYYQQYVSEFLTSPPSGPTSANNPNVTNYLESVAINTAVMSNIAEVINGFGTTNNAQNAITNASMTVTIQGSNNQSITLESSTASLTYGLLTSAQKVLQSAIPTVNSPNPNFINVAESYNNFVNSVYLENISVLQAMYTIEATNNYLNYLNYMATKTGIPLTQICPLEGISSEPNAIQNSARFYVAGSTGASSNYSSCNTAATSVYYPSNSFNPAQYSTLSYTNAESALILAQQQLTQLYTRRINMLYQQTMQFIYSDYAYPNQAINYINGENALSSSMQTIINSTQQLKLIESTIPGLSMISGNWVNSVDLYQYPITNLDVSRTNISNGLTVQESANSNIFPVIPTINNSNYPTVYQNIQSGYYDGESISVYNNYLSVNSRENPFYFAGYCGIESIGGYSAVESGLSFIGNTALYCNNWSGSIMANSSTLNSNLNIESFPALQNLIATPYLLNYGGCYYYFNFVNKNKYTYLPYSGMTCPSLPDNAYNNSNYAWYGMANNTQDSYAYYVAATSDSNNFTLLASSTYNSNTTGFNLGSGEFYTTGSGTGFSLNDGGFTYSGNISKAGAFSHSALLQVTLPNGYNFPFYVISYMAIEDPQKNTNINTYSSPICPSVLGITPSGISSCTQQSLGNGGLTVTTIDGNTYYLNVLQPTDGQEMQYGFFQISTTAQTACNTSNNNC